MSKDYDPRNVEENTKLLANRIAHLTKKEIVALLILTDSLIPAAKRDMIDAKTENRPTFSIPYFVYSTMSLEMMRSLYRYLIANNAIVFIEVSENTLDLVVTEHVTLLYNKATVKSIPDIAKLRNISTVSYRDRRRFQEFGLPREDLDKLFDTTYFRYVKTLPDSVKNWTPLTSLSDLTSLFE